MNSRTLPSALVRSCDGLGRRQRIAVGGHAVGDVDHQRRKTARKAAQEDLQIDCLAMARAWHIGVLPLALASNQTGNLNFCSMTPPAPSSTLRVRCSTRRGLLARALTGTRVWPARAPPRAGVDLAAVADDADVEVIADAVRLGALEDKVLQQAVDGVGDALGLVLVGLAAERLQHRAGLIDEKEKAGRIGAADLGGVGHARLSMVLGGSGATGWFFRIEYKAWGRRLQRPKRTIVAFHPAKGDGQFSVVITRSVMTTQTGTVHLLPLVVGVPALAGLLFLGKTG